MTNSKLGKGIGPGFIISAAFIGPGTVITCTAAGIRFGADLLWVMLFAGITTYVLQEMALRLSLSSGKDLALNIKLSFRQPGAGKVLSFLAASGIIIGCIAYQAGNLIGGASGINLIIETGVNFWLIVQGLLALFLLITGTYKVIEKFLVGLVALMSICFVTTAIMHPPELLAFLSGLFVPSIPNGSILTLIALLGTTVVPYNLFLHSTIANQKWQKTDVVTRGDIKGIISWARMDLLLGIGVGIAISISIMAAASVTNSTETSISIASMAGPLKNVLGQFGFSIFGTGLWAAGLTSAITAPLAAAYTFCGVFEIEAHGKTFKIVSASVLIVGLVLAMLSTSPVALIITAQAFNGLILPFVAVFLLKAVNTKSVICGNTNTLLTNGLSLVIIVFVFVLSARYFLQAFGVI